MEINKTMEKKMKKQFNFITLIILTLILSSCVSISTNDSFLIEPFVEEIHSTQHTKFVNYITASQNLYSDYYKHQKLEKNQEQYLIAVEKIVDGDYGIAESLLNNILKTSSDTMLTNRSLELLHEILFYQSKWEECVKAGTKDPKDNLLAEAYNGAKPEKWTFHKDSFTYPMQTSISGCPTVEVIVNGKKQVFWIDTGATLTVISSDIAKECNVNPINNKKVEIGTVTKNIEILPGTIDNLKIGDIEISNHPVMIFEKSVLEFKLFKIFKFLKIDGIIGLNAIKEIHLKLDFVNEKAIFSKPQKVEVQNRNLISFADPIVILKTQDGHNMNFFFDTGANNTYISKNFLTKKQLSGSGTKTNIVGGAGGMEKQLNEKFDNLTLILNKNALKFDKIISRDESIKDTDLYLRDGVLGSDIFQNKTIVIDFLNGRFELLESELSTN